MRIESWNIADDLSTDSYEKSYVREDYDYDDLGRLKSRKVTYGTSNSNQYSGDLYYSYNNLNQLTSLSTGGLSLAYQAIYIYNVQGQLEQLQNSTKSPWVTYTYNADGTINSETLKIPGSDRKRIYQYNTLKQITKINGSDSFSEKLDYSQPSFGYQDGNIQKYSSSFSIPDAQNYLYDYTYNAFGRLVSATSNINAMRNWAISTCGTNGTKGKYDANGNIWGSQGTCNTYVKGTNRLKKRGDNNYVYSYTQSGLVASIKDANNQVIQEFVYDTLLKRPIRITQSGTSDPQITQIIYDSKGERSRKTTTQGSTNILDIKYYRNGSQVVSEQIVKAANPSYWLYYHYGTTGLSVIGTTIRENPNQDRISLFLLKDYLGSIRTAYSSNSTDPVSYYNYSPFGSIVTENSSAGAGSSYDSANPLIASLCRYLYTGQEWDPELGLYNYHARQYDPTLARFLTPDPAGQSSSPYTYCNNNPINYVDPSGKTLTEAMFKSMSGKDILNHFMKNNYIIRAHLARDIPHGSGFVNTRFHYYAPGSFATGAKRTKNILGEVTMKIVHNKKPVLLITAAEQQPTRFGAPSFSQNISTTGALPYIAGDVSQYRSGIAKAEGIGADIDSFITDPLEGCTVACYPDMEEGFLHLNIREGGSTNRKEMNEIIKKNFSKNDSIHVLAKEDYEYKNNYAQVIGIKNERTMEFFYQLQEIDTELIQTENVTLYPLPTKNIVYL